LGGRYKVACVYNVESVFEVEKIVRQFRDSEPRKNI
jgi:hypothetical protein